MGYWRTMIGGFLLLCLFLSCTSPKLHQASAKADATVALLPELAGFDTVKTINHSFSYGAYGGTCYYGRVYVIVGTDLPEKQALAEYVESLQSSGWSLAGQQFDTERLLIRGTNERIVLRSDDEPDVDIADALDYDLLRAEYRNLIFITLDHIVPAREGC